MNDHPRIDSIDEPAIRAYRAGRIRQELHRQDHKAVLVVDPINLRYATGTRNMQVWTMHNIVRYALVFAPRRALRSRGKRRCKSRPR